MKWVVLPLVAAVALGTSGYLRALDDYADASLELARSSEAAPRTTADAAEGVESLPAVADLTSQQAAAFRALADALEVSADRVAELNGSLDEQRAVVSDIDGGIRRLLPLLDCIGGRLRRLDRSSGTVPVSLAAITTTLGRIEANQSKSIRHTRSINRKLAALGVVATATDVEAPKPPSGGDAPAPGGAPPGRPCG